MSVLYPIFLDLADRPCMVVGGGPVAEGKVRGLLAAGARVTVVSPTLTPALAALVAEGHLAHERREYTPSDLAGAALAFAATGDRAVSRAIRSEGRERGVWVNAAEAAERAARSRAQCVTSWSAISRRTSAASWRWWPRCAASSASEARR